MATARGAHAPRPTPSTRPRPRPEPRVVTGGARGIRWDRVSRVALLAVLLVLLLLYVGPLHSYWSTMHEAKQRRAQVTELQRENARLRVRRDALRSPGALEGEARRLGMVRHGERAYAIEQLPPGR